MSSKFKIESAQVNENIKNLQKFMKENGIDLFYISSFDPFLNEYVPMIDCHRFYVTNFSGSVAETLVPVEGKVKIYVDGRYHEQADLECDSSTVEVVKVPANTGVLATLKEDLDKLNYKNIGIESDRTSLSFYKYLEAKTVVKLFSKKELYSVIEFEKLPALSQINHLASKELRGSDTKDKLSRILSSENEAYFITAIDGLAWLTNSRGYHLPHLSSFLGRGFAVHNKVYVFIDKGVEYKCDDSSIEFINCDTHEISQYMGKILESYSIDKIFIDSAMLNTASYLMLKELVGDDSLVEKSGGLIEFHSIKEDAELDIIRDSFRRADLAIYNTIKWVKESVKNKESISELDLSNKTLESYKEQGALELSFGTIAGADANGSIIHYGDPKADVMIKKESMVLLDSGGYFESGFATDTTRTFMGADQEGSEKQKKIYTLVLKGTLALQNAVFKSGTKGSGLDAICRQPLYQEGYDYAHGTGHGVGIHVHEGGVGISPARSYIMKPRQVVSIEPGIYIPGFGGVRLENIAIVIDHPTYKDFLAFEPLVYIGFDPKLINYPMLTRQEVDWLDKYETECVKRGTSFLED